MLVCLVSLQEVLVAKLLIAELTVGLRVEDLNPTPGPHLTRESSTSCIGGDGLAFALDGGA